MTTPDFVVVGHVVRDLVPGGWRLGGTATFAAVQAQRLGLSVGVVTRAGPDLDLGTSLPGVAVQGQPSDQTTTFENIYDGETRVQTVLGHAPGLSVSDVSLEWRSAGLVLVGPVCGEVPPTITPVFDGALAAVSAQGWLREVDRTGRVRGVAWDGPPFWRGADVLFVSDEDVAQDDGQVESWTKDVPIVAMTSNRRGARVFDEGRWRAIATFPAEEVDPTGAGDIFATAFLVELHATNDVGSATRFASAAAACAIEAAGTEGIAIRGEIEARLRAHPEVVLQ